jgi:hypothetical protein
MATATQYKGGIIRQDKTANNSDDFPKSLSCTLVSISQVHFFRESPSPFYNNFLLGDVLEDFEDKTGGLVCGKI